MKKLLALSLAVVLGIAALTGCGAKAGDAQGEGEGTKKIVIGATSVPHAEILSAIKEELAAQGYDFEIKEFADYQQLNPALNDGQLDANFFQHKPYLDDFNDKNGTDLAVAGFVHYEPYGLYPARVKSIADLPDKAKIAVPNDGTNEARALILLEVQGLIKVNPDAGFQATKNDIIENPKNIEIIELDAAQIPRALPDVDMAVINGNYALEAGLNVINDAVAREEKDSDSATTFANVVAVRAGDESKDSIKALMNALQSEKVRQFIEERYKGAVVPMF